MHLLTMKHMEGANEVAASADLERSRFLKLALSAARAALWEYDVASDEVTASPELACLLGYPADCQVSIAQIRNGYLPGEGELIRSAASAAYSQGRSNFEVEFGHNGGDGQRRWLLLRAEIVTDLAGTPAKVVGVVLDHTRAKEAETALRSLNERLEEQVSRTLGEREMVWRLSNELFVLLKSDGTVIAANPAVGQLGYKVEEIVGRPASLFILDEDVAETGAAIARSAAEPVIDIEARILTKDGRPRWFSWSASPAEGLVVAIGRDVDEQKQKALEISQMQDALHRSQKMEAIGQLTGGVAHDFNNLLTVIRSSADLLRRSGLPEDRRRRYIDAISDTADRGAKLTAQLLAFSRRQPLRPATFDVGVHVAVVAEMLQTVMGEQTQLIREDTCEKCLVHADPAQFETALINMILNARDALNGRGVIKLDVRATSAAPAAGQGAGADELGFVAVSISDDGPGIDEAVLARVFEPFFTTKELGKGTGLGLSQVYGFAKQSRGEVTVESTLGRGATFTMYLPRSSGSLPPPERQLEVETGTEGGRVLIVEDNEDIGRFARELLTDLGYEAERVSTAEKALARLANAAEQFDIVFSDVMMPGMSGLEMAQELKRSRPELPIVLTSGYSDALALDGVQGFELLQKPYSVEDLSRTLRRQLNLKKSHVS